MTGPLSDLKIVEVGEMVSAPYASKLLADMGAEVIKIERPGAGDRARSRGPFPGGISHPEKSGLFLYLNTNKLGITVDLAQREGFEIFEKLLAGADLLIHNVAPPDMDRTGLSYERLRKVNPSLIMTSVLPYGLSGPKRDWRAENLNLWCAGGVCYLNGGGPQSGDLPPLKTFGDQAGYQGAVHAAAAAMGAVIARLRDRDGQHIEVSVQESVAAEMEMVFEYWPYIKMIGSRLGQKPLQPVEIFECKDGYIYVCCIEEHQWRAFVDLMGNPEWADDGDLRRPAATRDQLGCAQTVHRGVREHPDRARSLSQGAGSAGAVRAGFDDGRPAQLGASQGARLFCRDRATGRGHAQVSRRAGQIRTHPVGDSDSRAHPGAA